ncbi:MAG: hypothetical protein RL199_1845 [Pseudomonadota bacterium]|jgi:predicted RNA-binding Zn-ribbon protein involved in translation (DUF1610 family)
MTDRATYCAACRRSFDLKRRTVRRDECPHCGAELHACVNCQHFDARYVRGCQEPSAVAEEAVRDTDRANFCQWFDHRRGPPASGGASTSEAKAAFDALFGGAPNASDAGAASAFDDLFRQK